MTMLVDRDPQNDASPDDPTSAETKGRGRKATAPPLSSLATLKKETSEDVFSLSADELCRRVYSGIILHDKEKNIAIQKFWVDEVLDKNCFLVLSKNMCIAWIHDSRYWEYIEDIENCFEGEKSLPVAKLKQVCWLEVTGSFKTIRLCPKTTYEVAFVVKMSEQSYGWHLPVTVNLYLPDGSTQGRTEILEDKPREEWFRILIGSFVTSRHNVGELRFKLRGTGDHWKTGLIVKGVLMQAKD